ncbi:MAG: PQQ-dependent sugar dehydrogenase [SAR324 cluster bacterium]|nr:PQQ-dependent sugar dehydrogenase [SAR324 cluster bacterium]
MVSFLLPFLPMSVGFFPAFLYLLLSSTSLWASEPTTWKTIPGYGVKTDTSGWNSPVDLQFVDAPQSSPKAPLYYVAERQGLVKLVTQDRSVSVYADMREMLGSGQISSPEKDPIGLVGLCLDQENGQLFSTLVYQKNGQLMNTIVQLSSNDSQIAVTNTNSDEISSLFQKESSKPLPRIGDCWIGLDQKLYVGFSDGDQAQKTHSLEHLNGKILRINTDGTSPSDNPFYKPQTPDKLSSYIYASGLRQPFAITESMEAQLYATDNGPGADRLIPVLAGRDYLWDGNNSSILTKSIRTWSPALKPDSMVFLNSHLVFPQWNRHLLIASPARIEVIPVDREKGVLAAPVSIFQYFNAKENQSRDPMSLALGPDGIYFTGTTEGGKTPIQKFVLDTSRQSEAPLQKLSGEEWYAQLECDSCHRISGKGGQAGPLLDGLIPRLDQRLNTKSYLEQLDRMDQLTEEMFVQYKERRQTLRSLEGKEKIEFWIESRLTEPRFDAVDSQMQNLHLSEQQIEALTEFLMTLSGRAIDPQNKTLKQRVEDLKFFLTTHLWIWLSLIFLLGLILGFCLKFLIRFVRGRFHLKKRFGT